MILPQPMPNNKKKEKEKRPVSHPTPRLFEAFLQTPQFQLQRPLLSLHPTHKIANSNSRETQIIPSSSSFLALLHLPTNLSFYLIFSCFPLFEIKLVSLKKEDKFLLF
jgi:hypothetical protein